MRCKQRPVQNSDFGLADPQLLDGRMLGWKPRLDEHNQPSAYHNVLGLAFASFQSAGVDIADLVVKAAVSTGGSAPSSESEHSVEVWELFDERRIEVDPALRKCLSKGIWKALRRQRRQKEQTLLTH